jgi:hypothetical protein
MVLRNHGMLALGESVSQTFMEALSAQSCAGGHRRGGGSAHGKIDQPISLYVIFRTSRAVQELGRYRLSPCKHGAGSSPRRTRLHAKFPVIEKNTGKVDSMLAVAEAAD